MEEPDGLLSMGSQQQQQQQQDKCLDAGLCWEEVMIPSLFPAEGLRVHGEEASLGPRLACVGEKGPECWGHSSKHSAVSD